MIDDGIKQFGGRRYVVYRCRPEEKDIDLWVRKIMDHLRLPGNTPSEKADHFVL